MYVLYHQLDLLHSKNNTNHNCNHSCNYNDNNGDNVELCTRDNNCYHASGAASNKKENKNNKYSELNNRYNLMRDPARGL